MPTPFVERRQERVLRRIEELRAWRNQRESTIPEWTYTGPDGVAKLLRLGDFWPAHEMPVNFTTTAAIPKDWGGEAVELELWVGGEGFVRLSTGYQAGLNPMHHRFPVTAKAKGGEAITIEVEAVPKGIFGTNVTEPRLERAQFVIPQREARDYERDLTMLLEATRNLPGHEVVPFLLDVAERSLSELADGWPSATDVMVSRYVLGYDNGLGAGVNAVPRNWGPEAVDAYRPTDATWSLPPAPRALEPLPNEAVKALRRARKSYADGIKQVLRDYPPVGNLVLTGHAHIDLAWLWPYAETRRKTRRTFSTVLDLMDRYPDFTFNQSSAQVYAWIEQDDPAVFERIKKRVAEGRWEPIGGMWLESDCNVTGGEAFVRQLFYGQRYFEKTFGKRNKTVWLPDVFGFSGGIPQLLRGAGFSGFFTIKLNWNEENRFPHDLFEWEGIDGSRVNANLFLNPGEGYNGNIVPLDTIGTWRNHRDKTIYPESLLAFGWGDGAGGPTEKMLENYDRIKEFPALPRLRMGLIEEFFAGIPTEGLPRWVGELYLELHRGTLTTQAWTKQLNRLGEHRLLEAEAFGALAKLGGHAYDGPAIEAAWKSLLLNQFHDVLPGSSINEVYKDAHAMVEETVATATSVRNTALTDLGGTAAEGKVLVANAGIHPRPLQIQLEFAGEATVTASDSTALPVQPIDGGVLVGGTSVPSIGWSALTVGSGKSKAAVANPVAVKSSRKSTVIQNDQLTVEIGADGTIQSIYDKTAGRQAFAGRGNQLWAYVDKPRSWDAWDVDETYERDGEEIGGVGKVAVVESGPLRVSVRVERTYRNSTIVQTYRLWSGSRRLDIETEIDWHQRQVLVKALFPVGVRTDSATFETMFGVIKRATHRNTSWDKARFEVGAHRFADLSEPGFGVAILNDAKYAYGVHDNVLNLSLLRSPMYPDALADEGNHHFTYSVFPHVGDWTTAGVTAEAFALNSPLVIGSAGDKTADRSFVSVSGVELGLGALKPAEDGKGVILRVYEPHGYRGRSTLLFDQRVSAASRVNLLEEADGSVASPEVSGNAVSIEVRPFEVVTLRLALA